MGEGLTLRLFFVMKKILLINFLLFFTLYSVSADEISNALDNADNFFRSMENKNYTQVWSLLSIESKEKILDDIVDSYKAAKSKAPSTNELANDFATCRTVCTSYWDGFLIVFKPEEILENSEWSVLSVKNKYIEIQIINSKAAKPAVLKMYKENGQWTVGLTESFWLRRYFQN